MIAWLRALIARVQDKFRWLDHDHQQRYRMAQPGLAGLLLLENGANADQDVHCGLRCQWCRLVL